MKKLIFEVFVIFSIELFDKIRFWRVLKKNGFIYTICLNKEGQKFKYYIGNHHNQVIGNIIEVKK